MVNWLVLHGMVGFSCKMCGRCCKGWNIYIDKTKYRKLREIMDEKILNEIIEVLPGGKKDAGFARVADENRVCGFLEENNLCKVHRRYGPEYLPDICAVFPRRIFITPRGIEVSVVFSCPETMKLLLSKEIIQVTKNPPGFFFDISHISLPTITKEIIDSTDEKRWYFRLEETFMNILQDRVLSLEMRMAIIGLLVYRFHEYPYDKKRQREYPELLKSYRGLAKQARSLEINLDYQMWILKSFLDFRTSLYPSNDFSQIVDRVNEALDLTPGQPLTDNSIKLYQVKLKELYNEREIGYVVGNYLVYTVFSKLLLINGLEGGFHALSFLYSLIRFLAVGTAVSEGVPVNQNILLKIIEAVDYNIKHSVEFMDHILLAQGIEKCEREHVSVARSLALLTANRR